MNFVNTTDSWLFEMNNKSAVPIKHPSQHSLRLRHLAESEKNKRKQGANKSTAWSVLHKTFNGSDEQQDSDGKVAFLGYN